MNLSSGSAFLPILGAIEACMLTPEERQRIEEEEHKRIAEEQYRAEVRAKLQGGPAAPVKRSGRIPWILGVGTVLIIGTIVLTNSRSQPRTGDDGGTSRPIPVCADRRFRVDESTPNAGH
jgi:hypothetical protein